ncbi:MAG: hypothetical protein IPK12_11720 [Gemmatimonadetes bacterium]|nr:hypothetical protein [Gemmatimonadota bacterium]
MAGLSVIVPVHGRQESLDRVYQEYAPALMGRGEVVEFLFVFPPDGAQATRPLEPLKAAGAPIRILQLAQPAGLARLTRAGATHATHAFAARTPERETGAARLHRRLFHWLARPVSKGQFRDLGSGVGAVRRDALLATPAYGDFFRFLPALMMREGFAVAEVPVARHAADQRPSVYPPGTYFRSLIDLLGMYFLARFTERPLRFFGLVGLLLALPGVVLLAVLLVQRIEGVGIANRPALLLGTLLLALGVQAIALGLVAEIIVHLNAPTRRSYRLARGSDGPQPE